MIGSDQQQQSSTSGSQMSLEQKLDLLESRFTQPTVPTSDNSDKNFQSLQTPSWGNQDNLIAKQPLASTPQSYTSTNTPHSTGRMSPHHSSSEHSFQFSRQQNHHSPQNSNPLPQSSVRSRRRLSLPSSTFQTVAMAAAKHMRKVAASSPVQGLSTNPNHSFQPIKQQLDGSRSCSSSSNATMITSNQKRIQQNNNTKEQRVVPESPPVIVSPQNNATPVRKPNKPNAVRNLMGNAPTRSSPRKKKHKTENESANESNIMTRSRSTGKSSSPPPAKSTSTVSYCTSQTMEPSCLRSLFSHLLPLFAFLVVFFAYRRNVSRHPSAKYRPSRMQLLQTPLQNLPISAAR